MTWMASNMMNTSVLSHPRLATVTGFHLVFGVDPPSSSLPSSSASASASPPPTASASRRSGMSNRLSLVMTTFGFVVSAIFIMFVLVRLLCARFHSWRFASEWARGVDGSTTNQSIERHSSGLNPVLITMFPTIIFAREMFASQEDTTCIVCLEEYEDGDVLRIVPACGHAFHMNCIDAWLSRHTSCPVCRIHIQNASSRRNLPSTLLSEAARTRFCPGAIPESLFANPVPHIHPATDIQQCLAMVGRDRVVHVVRILDVKDVIAHTSISSV